MYPVRKLLLGLSKSSHKQEDEDVDVGHVRSFVLLCLGSALIDLDWGEVEIVQGPGRIGQLAPQTRYSL